MNFEKMIKNFGGSLLIWKAISGFPDALIFLNIDGEILYANTKAKKIFNQEHNSFNQVNVNDIFEDGLNTINKILTAQTPILTRANAAEQPYIEVNAARVFAGYIISIRDVSSLTKTIINEEKTINFNNEKNAMLSIMADDLKSPLTSITGFSQGLLDGIGGELTEKQAKYIEIIKNNSKDLYNILDKLIEFSGVESSIYTPEYSKFDIVQTIKTITNDFQNKISNKNIELKIDYNTLETMNVYTDIKAIKQIIKNILNFSVKNTEKGFININISNPTEDKCQIYNIDPSNNKSYISIIIEDSGVGIPQEDIKYLCDPYAQLGKNKKYMYRAFLLGSASILLKRINGMFDIKSEIPTGNHFEIIFPIEKSDNE